MNPMAHALSMALLHLVWQGVVAAAVLWVALALLRNHSANARYLASCAVLAALAIAPAVTGWLEYAPAPPAGAIERVRGALSGIAGTPVGTAGIDWLALAQHWAL